ncbi:YhhN-like protein [Legionella massiliensis]|uniref:YhhN-like protein n=1 Tax=Legionella massiliensis TaxID=1034943 RepID=A0A078KTB9_9GAMM|nr:lysoplasmalogenase [Legionella massiliensis]CDZ76311.1 YhhN-like protein [Legionella massiliensis]CEE12049.1 YhhN-like protein [Legionella massiliensis]
MYGLQPRRLTIMIILSMVIYLLLMPFTQFPVNALFKIIPILLLILLTCQTIAKSQTRTLLVLALFFSVLGDAVLTTGWYFALPIGILLFICVHCSYIRLFLLHSQYRRLRVIVFLPIAFFIALSFYYEEPSLHEMKILVMVYGAIISLMIFAALQVKEKQGLIASGALLFLFSDFIFSLNQFVFPYSKAINGLVISLYYSAQFLLVRGIRSLEGINPNFKTLTQPVTLT